MSGFRSVEAEPAGVGLEMELLGTTYENPLVVASGTLIERAEQIDPFLEAGAGAVIPRTTRFVMERTVHPSPHLYQEGSRSRANMLNAEWTGADINYWRPYLSDMSETKKVIMGVSGRDVEGCVKVCKELDDYDFPLLEINIGCGVTNGTLGYITRDEEHIRRVCTEIKDAGVATPIALKLGHSDFIVHLADVAKDSGADAIVAVNTLGPMFDFSIEDGEPQRVLGVSGARGGLSGQALFHTALTDVALISREVGLPVLASGGVNSPERAMKMIFAGASLVQIYTYLHERGVEAPNAMADFKAKFAEFTAKHGIAKISQAKGKALALMDEPTQLKPQVPVVSEENCTGCDRCVPLCLPEAFTKIPANNRNGHTVAINEDSCVGCGHCVTQCPVENTLTLPR